MLARDGFDMFDEAHEREFFTLAALFGGEVGEVEEGAPVVGAARVAVEVLHAVPDYEGGEEEKAGVDEVEDGFAADGGVGVVEIFLRFVLSGATDFNESRKKKPLC